MARGANKISRGPPGPRGSRRSSEPAATTCRGRLTARQRTTAPRRNTGGKGRECLRHLGRSTGRTAQALGRGAHSLQYLEPLSTLLADVLVQRHLSLHTRPGSTPRRWVVCPRDRPRSLRTRLRSSGTARAERLKWVLAATRRRTANRRPARAVSPPAPCSLPLPVCLCRGLAVVRAGGATPAAPPAPGRIRHRSSGHAEAGQHHPLQERPRHGNADQPPHIARHPPPPDIIAARPWAIVACSASSWRWSPSQQMRQMSKMSWSEMK